MSKCQGQPRKRRVHKPHSGKRVFGAGNPYRLSYRGHSWEGHGMERRCALCGRRPR